MDLAAQIIETFAIWTLTHYQPRLYPTSAWLGALKTAGKGKEVVLTSPYDGNVLTRANKN